MIHHPKGSRPDSIGPADWFTGAVTMTPIIEAPSPARVRGALVHFSAGARTAWHTHPLGQTIHIVSGTGRAQRAGGPVITLNPGDTVWFDPGERHWHGASPNSEMAHIAVQEALDGRAVDWAEQVSDADYTTPPSA